MTKKQLTLRKRIKKLQNSFNKKDQKEGAMYPLICTFEKCYEEQAEMEEFCKKHQSNTKQCERCSRPYTGYPALSRRDNKTDICSQCGTEEAMIDMGRGSLPAPILREINFLYKLMGKRRR